VHNSHYRGVGSRVRIQRLLLGIPRELPSL
jgi:hypothetical protein